MRAHFVLIIEHPDHSAPETAYALSVIFDDFLGIPYETRPIDGDLFRLRIGDGLITLNSTFLPALARQDTAALFGSVPDPWDSRETGWSIPLVDPVLPVLFGEPAFERNERHLHLGIDIVGAAFFMLSRYEETISDQRDLHDRFPVKEALAYQRGFLLRPIIDEYVEVLWAAIQHFCPSLKRKERSFTIVPTHDVDIPYLGQSLNSIKRLVQRCGGDIILRKSPASLGRTIETYLRARFVEPGCDPRDPYDVFDWFMELSEQAGVRSRFNFMIDCEPQHAYGGTYDINAPHIGNLIKKLAGRGHEIGIHPTGESSQDEAVMLGQSKRFRQAMDKYGIKQDIVGGRQHFLKWRPKKTPRFWHDAGLNYDSTLGHADHVGFRCGTCHPFPLWDWSERKRLDVMELPLILMEDSLIAERYMGRDPSEAATVVKQLQDAARTVRGNFVFLWHNSAILAQSDRDLYRVCLNL